MIDLIVIVTAITFVLALRREEKGKDLSFRFLMGVSAIGMLVITVATWVNKGW